MVFLDQAHVAGEAARHEHRRTLGGGLAGEDLVGDELATHLLGGFAELVERDDLAPLAARRFGCCGLPRFGVLVAGVIGVVVAVLAGEGFHALSQ